MLNVQVSRRKDTEDYVAVDTLPHSMPFTMRQFFVICSVCIFSVLCALPVLSPSHQLNDEEEDAAATSLYALLGTPQVRPTAINEKQMGEQYLSANEENVVVAQTELTEENFDDDITLPRDFFIVQNAANRDQAALREAETAVVLPPVKVETREERLELSVTPEAQEPQVVVPPLTASVESKPEVETEVEIEADETVAQSGQPVAEPAPPAVVAQVQEVKPEPKVSEVAVAKPAEKRPTGTWYQLTVKKGQSLSEIFTELNLPAATLRRLKKVAKGRELTLGEGDKLHLLVDEHNILKELVKPLGQGEQVRYTRLSSKSQFTVVHEKRNAHVGDPKETEKFLDALKMPSAVEAAQKAAKLEEQRLAQQSTQASQDELEEAYNLAYINRPQLVVGKIEAGENIKKAARRLGLDQIALSELQNAVITKVNLTRLRPDDSLRILFSGRGASSHIEAIEINSQIYGRVTVFKHPQNNNFYAENEFRPTTGVFRRFPITGQIMISSQFNPRRIHPILRRVSPHNGVDFKVPIGTPVYSPADGVVTFAGFVRGGGYTVIIKHFNDYATVYMHLSKFDVKNGQEVKAGQIIAKSGNTGRSTGPHLHYEIRINDHPVDPLKVDLPSNRTPKLAQAEKIAFDNNVRSLKAQLYKK